MKLEEAKLLLKRYIKYSQNKGIFLQEHFYKLSKAIETVLQELDNSINKDKITKFIKKELPDDEICVMCDVYDVNGIEVKNELQKLLEEK